MNSGSAGRFNRLRYDNCAAQRDDIQRTDPLKYQMYGGKFAHKDRCAHEGNVYHPYDLVDVDTELRGINRFASECAQFKYNPGCKKSAKCMSTFDESVPVVLAPEVCPIVKSNIPRVNNPGFAGNYVASCMNN